MISTPTRALIFDFIRTLYDPVNASLYPGVRSMLEDAKASRRLILYSRKDRSRSELLKETGIEHLFDAAYFVEKKDAANLAEILAVHGLLPGECVVVGDMMTSELAAASELGADTVWFRQQSFANVLDSGSRFEPTHTVRTISELDTLLRKIP